GKISKKEYKRQIKFISDSIDPEGKIRGFLDTELKKQKDAVRRRVKLFKESFPVEGKDFAEHLAKNMKNQPMGYIYHSDEKWETLG
ncbi:MAG: hypothetical protein JZU65_14045, partial [Chlorobium sp.]|nr:hypothetical protein [Chlorobium sp.]